MKVRIKFSKMGEMRFIGHLDLMRFFQKVIRRSDLDIKYSEGMSPHMIMSFASPLGIGLTSRGEYVDIELNTPVTTQEGLERLNAASVDGITFLDLRQIEEGKAGKAMSLVAAADYEVRFRKGHEPAGDWQSDISGFFARKQIEIEKDSKKAAKKEAKREARKKGRGHGKKPERTEEKPNADTAEALPPVDDAGASAALSPVDDAGPSAALSPVDDAGASAALSPVDDAGASAVLSPVDDAKASAALSSAAGSVTTAMLSSGADASVSEAASAETGSSATTDIRPMIYEMHVNAGTVFMKLASGSAANLKPDTVMKAYCDWKGIPTDPFAFEVERVELYADLGKESRHRFVSLNELGNEVTPEMVSLDEHV